MVQQTPQTSRRRRRPRRRRLIIRSNFGSNRATYQPILWTKTKKPARLSSSERKPSTLTGHRMINYLLGVARLVDGEHIVFYTARRHEDYYEALSKHFAQHPPTDWLREFFSTPDDLIPDPPPLTGPNRNLTQDAAGNLISRRTWEQLRRDERAKKASVDWRNETSRMGYLRMQAIISWTPRE